MTHTPEELVLTNPSKPPPQFAGAKALKFGVDQHGRHCVWATCSACESCEGMHLRPNQPPIAVQQGLGERHGWKFGKDFASATCPKCQEGKPSTGALKGQRLVFRLLEEHLRVDAGLGEYEPGWSDARIAEEAKLDEKFVAEVRRDGFAPHLRDRLREELRAECVTFRAQAEKEIAEIRDMARDALDRLRAELTRLEGRLRQ